MKIIPIYESNNPNPELSKRFVYCCKHLMLRQVIWEMTKFYLEFRVNISCKHKIKNKFILNLNHFSRTQ